MNYDHQPERQEDSDKVLPLLALVILSFGGTAK